jgi:hypothetical protein
LRAHPEHLGDRGDRGLDLGALEQRVVWDAPPLDTFARADGMRATANTSERRADLMLWPVCHRWRSGVLITISYQRSEQAGVKSELRRSSERK